MSHTHQTISQAALIALLHKNGGELTITKDLIDDMVAQKFGVLIKEDGKRGNWILSYAKPDEVGEFFKDKHCTCVDPEPRMNPGMENEEEAMTGGEAKITCAICNKPITPISNA